MATSHLTKRNDSCHSSLDLPSPWPSSRSSITFSHPRILTYSIPYSAGVSFEHAPPQSSDRDDGRVIIFATVPLTRAEVPSSSELSARSSTPCGLVRRLADRFAPSPPPDDFKFVKMPRAVYRAKFARDGMGRYLGTEPEREWDLPQLEAELRQYRDLPLGTVWV